MHFSYVKQKMNSEAFIDKMSEIFGISNRAKWEIQNVSFLLTKWKATQVREWTPKWTFHSVFHSYSVLYSLTHSLQRKGHNRSASQHLACWRIPLWKYKKQPTRSQTDKTKVYTEPTLWSVWELSLSPHSLTHWHSLSVPGWMDDRTRRRKEA